MKKRLSDAKEEEGCCSKFGSWICRNFIHMMLLACAVLAIVAAILGSLGACGSETDQEVSVTPLSLFLSLDASNSMAGSMSGNWTTLIDTPPYDCRKRYKVNRRNPIANFSCWPTPSAASMLSH